MDGRPAPGAPAALGRRGFLRLSGLALGTGAVGLGATGCRGLVPNTGSGDANSLTMSWWAEAALSELHVDVVEQYMADNTGVTVRSQYQPQNGYDDKLSTQLAGGGAPDVFMLRRATFADYISRGAVRQLDDLVPGTLPFDELPEVLQAAAQYRGHWYAIPLGVAASPAILANSTVLARLGIALPAADWTLDDFEATLTAVRDATGGEMFGATEMGGSEYALAGHLAGDGKPLFTDDGRPGFSRGDLVEWYSTWEGFRADGLAPPMGTSAAQTGFATDPLVAGLTALTLAPSSKGINGYQSLVADQLELLTYPRRSASGATATSVGPIEWFALSSRIDAAKAQQAAQLALFFARDVTALETLNLAHGVPLEEEARAATYAEQTDLNRRIYDNVAQIQELGPAPVSSYPPSAAEFLTEVFNGNQQVGFGQVSVDEAVDQVFAAADRLLA